MKKKISPAVVNKRTPGWEERLVNELNRQMTHKFEWGKFDCLTQQADVFKALTGAQIFPLKLRKYSTELGAAKLMQFYGFEDIEQVLNACFSPIAPAMARRGDCGLLAREQQGTFILSALTVFGGFALGRDQAGPIRVPVLALNSAYRMG